MRWRLAAVSAGLTLAILLVFGGAIGQIATSRIRDDFNDEVHNAAETLAAANSTSTYHRWSASRKCTAANSAPTCCRDDAVDRGSSTAGGHG